MEISNIDFCGGLVDIHTCTYSNYSDNEKDLTETDTVLTMYLYVKSATTAKSYQMSEYRKDLYYVEFKFKINYKISLFDEEIIELNYIDSLTLEDYTVSKNGWDFRHNSSEACRKYFKEELQKLFIFKRPYQTWIALLKEERKNYIQQMKEAFQRKEDTLEKQKQEAISFKNKAAKLLETE